VNGDHSRIYQLYYTKVLLSLRGQRPSPDETSDYGVNDSPLVLLLWHVLLGQHGQANSTLTYYHHLNRIILECPIFRSINRLAPLFSQVSEVQRNILV